jgi:hypothetical protein
MSLKMNLLSPPVEKSNSSEVMPNLVPKPLLLELSKFFHTKDSDSNSSSSKSTLGMMNGYNSGLMAKMFTKNNSDSALPDKPNSVVPQSILG